MARKPGSELNLLVLLPWWASMIAAAIVYAVLTYGPGLIQVQGSIAHPTPFA